MTQAHMIWIGREEGAALPWISAAQAAGWKSEALPLIEWRQLPLTQEETDSLRSMNTDDWVFLTSPYAARLFREEFADTVKVRLAVTGDATAHALRPIKPSLVSNGNGGAQLALDYMAMGKQKENTRRVHFAAREPRPELRETLGASGLQLDHLSAYETKTMEGPTPSRDESVLLFSPSGASSLSQRCENNSTVTVMALGETTARCASALGFPVACTLDEPDPSALTKELMQWVNTT